MAATLAFTAARPRRTIAAAGGPAKTELQEQRTIADENLGGLLA